jgi:hypothetical protein
MLGLYRDLYRGFTVKHFHEELGKRHHYTLGYTGDDHLSLANTPRSSSATAAAMQVWPLDGFGR